MFDNVLVRDWMTNSVISVVPDTAISSAHQTMKEHGIRRVPVLEDDKLVGIVTIGDIREASPSDATTLSIWELNYLWAQLIVEKIMTRNVLVVHPDTPILDAAELMLDQKVSGLPVIDAQNHLVGMITESDIFRMLVTSRNTITA
jgi:acetoin utilization protein AcuB